MRENSMKGRNRGRLKKWMRGALKVGRCRTQSHQGSGENHSQQEPKAGHRKMGIGGIKIKKNKRGSTRGKGAAQIPKGPDGRRGKEKEQRSLEIGGMGRGPDVFK